ncbi:VanZ family protein [Telmatobacter bradus]|uniref:VanZ family protein n=1 Tax=Telmatobacter bradus TaxID=474953 RepID=UPI003B42C939
MSNSRRSAAFWIQAWWPVALATTVIFMESTVTMGADHTAGPIRRLLEYFFGPFSELTFQNIHFLIRKSGHFIGYGLVGLSWLHAAWRLRPHWNYLRCELVGLAGAFLTACCDELHQSFLPNREGCFRDVLIDTVGAFVLATLAWCVLRIFYKFALRNPR